jgi:hypothetical protein
MKAANTDYIAQENAHAAEWFELYHVWTSADHWYYTSGDKQISYAGGCYEPAPITRGAVQYSSRLRTGTVDITLRRGAGPVQGYVAGRPPELVWVSITRFSRDLAMAAGNANTIFVGHVTQYQVTGAAVTVHCVGFQAFLKRQLQRFRFQATCNWSLFDSRCGLSAESYAVTKTVTVYTRENRNTLANSDFDWYGNDYFELGRVLANGRSYLVASHKGSFLTMRYPILDIETGDTVTVYPGCNGNLETCINKFSNETNFGGFPFIPDDNPVLWR